MLFIVEVVKQARDAPEVFVFIEFPSVGDQCRLDSQHVLDQIFVLGVSLQQVECI